MRSPTQAAAALREAPGGSGVLAAVQAVPGAWVVGGAVRDALLGRPVRDLDLVVEGEPEPLLDALGGEVEARHERFGTATVRLPGGARVDVVRARAERYPTPGALPEVRPGSLGEDLRRRDVTVNALALRPDGLLRGTASALGDLRDGVLRVLHPASFRDDPTRLWRVARYAARLGFAVDPVTGGLARAADPASAGPTRMGAELRRALAEPDPLGALRAARDLHPALLPAALDLDPRGLSEALALLPAGEGDPGLLTLAAAAAPMDTRELLAWLGASGLPAEARDLVGAGSRASTLEPLRRATRPSEVVRAAAGAPVELVALAGGPNARRYLDELRHVGLQIGGDDLLAAGVPAGPEVGRRLRQALDRKLDEGLEGREAELAAALG